MLLPVKLWAATYSTGAHSNWLYVTCRKHVTAKESQTLTEHMFRNFSQELADQTRANTPVTIGLEVWEPKIGLQWCLWLARCTFLWCKKHTLISVCDLVGWDLLPSILSEPGLLFFFRFVATFNNEITVIEICIGLWSRPLILSGIGSPFTLLLVFQFSVEYKGKKKKSVHFTTKCVQPFVNDLKNSVLNTGFSLTIAKPLINTVEQNHTDVFNYSGWINFNSGWSNQATWQHLCGWMKNDHACRC